MIKIKKEEIKRIVEKCYQNLYRGKGDSQRETGRIFGEKQYYKADNWTEADTDSFSEIAKVFRKQKNRKSPGWDGIPARYYKPFEDILLKSHKKLVEAIAQEGIILSAWTEALIITIHKEGTEAMEI